MRGDALPVNTGQHRHGYADDSHSEGEKGSIITEMAAVQPANAAYYAADGCEAVVFFPRRSKQTRTPAKPPRLGRIKIVQSIGNRASGKNITRGSKGEHIFGEKSVIRLSTSP
ncbi:MAG: hypothetical protein DMG70_28165 [Acidobacteria bacterium]|nr:MAG: hypothetical protein DMG70_28165 [Acidobacteriota bacterium]